MSAASKAASSSGRSGRRKRSRVSATSLRKAGVVSGRAGERGDRVSVGVGGVNLAPAGEPEREGAGAAEQIRDFSCLRERLLGERSEPHFARFGRLQEAAGRQLDQRFAELDARRPALDH